MKSWNKLGEAIQRMEVKASTNIQERAMAAGIPGTSYTGMPYASRHRRGGGPRLSASWRLSTACPATFTRPPSCWWKPAR